MAAPRINTPAGVHATGLPSSRRSFLSGLASAPLAAVPLLATSAAASDSQDVIPVLLAEKRRVNHAVSGGHYATEAEVNALMDRWGECEVVAIANPASTIAGALASLEWVREELVEFGLDCGEPDKGTQIVMALVDGALAVLRSHAGREGGVAGVSIGGAL